MPTFQIQLNPGDSRDHRCTLVLSGEADLAVADDIIELGIASLDDAETTVLVLDLRAVTFIDSSALGALIHLKNLAVAADKQLHLMQVPTRVQKVMALAGLETVFTVADEDQSSL